MDGTFLWRIDLGRNIRAGAHYTQYIVYDFDGDGKAELATKTAPGSKDGKGNYVTAVGNTDTIKNADNSKEYIYTGSGKANGHILDGPEYLTIFNGMTGEAMQTIDYIPQRGNVSSWGDSYGNRADRMLAGVAYLDGVHPSLIMCRGYYTRSVVAAFNWDGKELKEVWTLDSGTDKKHPFFGQGNHQISVADLDNDGKDEIIYGSAAIDDDGSVLHSKGWGHGDALHVSDFNNDGEQEIFSVLEDSPNWGTALRKADGTEVFHTNAKADTGRGIMAVISEKLGALGWSSEGTYIDEADGKKKYFAFDMQGKRVNFPGNQSSAPNFAIYWDGDLLRELADGSKIIKWNDTTNTFDRLWTITNNNPVGTNNTTKNNPCLQADLFGDWREEIILRHADNSALRIFTSITPTDYKIPTLMHDSQYRCAIAWQNVAYNQPPHQSFYIGPDKTEYTQPNIVPASKNKAAFTITDTSGNPVSGAKIEIDESITAVTNSEGKAETPILAGTHKYTVKCVGYEPAIENEFTVNENDEITNVSKSLTAKTHCDITISVKTSDGKELKPDEKLTSIPAQTGFVLEESYKEDITAEDGTVYEYNPNLSSVTSFKLVDDTEVNLVFVEKTLPGKYGTEYFRTNFSSDGFLKTSEKHGYTAGDPVGFGVNGGVKYGTYSIGDNTVTVKLPEGISGKFIAEFDMSFNSSEGALGGTVFGITPKSGNKVGPTIGVRLNGSLNPTFATFAGTGSTQTKIGSASEKNKMYRYLIEYDGEKLYLTVGDIATGEIVQPKLEAAGGRNITLGTDKIDSFMFNRTGSRASGSNPSTDVGNANISIGDFRVYSISSPNNFEWETNSTVTANIPSETKLAPTSYNFSTGIGAYKINVDGNITYSLTKADGTAVPAESGVTIDENGTLTISETAAKDNYKVKCEYNGTVVREYNITAIKHKVVDIYNSASDTAGTLLKDEGKEDAKLSYSKGEWTFTQNSTTGGSREFYGNFFPTTSGEATFGFTFKTGGTKDANEQWNWAGREYDFDIQLLDADYNGENPEDHVVLGFSQEKTADNTQEVQYYTKSSEKAYVNNDSNVTGTIAKAFTARSSTTWNVTVKFNFDSNTVSFDFMDETSTGGFRYENIPTNGGFKTLRIVSNGDAKVDWKPKISNITYTKLAYEPTSITSDTINLRSGKNSISLDFDKPYDGGAPVTYKASLIDPESGNTSYEKETTELPIVFENVPAGEYKFNVKVISGNIISTNEEVLAGPFTVTVSDKIPVEIQVENDSVTDSSLNLTAKVTTTVGEQKGVVYAALYDSDGNIISSDSKEKNFADGENTADFSLDTKGKSNIVLKIFVWDSAEGMKPLYSTPAFTKTYK